MTSPVIFRIPTEEVVAAIERYLNIRIPELVGQRCRFRTDAEGLVVEIVPQEVAGR